MHALRRKVVGTAHLKAPKLELLCSAHVGVDEEDNEVVHGAPVVFGFHHDDVSRVTEYRRKQMSRAICLTPGDARPQMINVSAE